MRVTTDQNMEQYKHDFLKFAIECGVLRFGEFTLKSGRNSPYFFNAGLFNRGAQLAQLGRYYASAVLAADVPFDVIFGPAYKGIPLAAALAIALAEHHDLDMPWCFNRKEKKDHGEGGNLVGAPLAGQVLIIDDVITAGTAIRESLQMISTADAQAAGVVVCLDRQEKGQEDRSAIQEIEEDFGMPVISIVSLDDLVTFLSQDADRQQDLESIKSYQVRYGI